MSTKKKTGKGAAEAAPALTPTDTPSAEDAAWAVDPVPPPVRAHLKNARLSLDMHALADAFEVYQSTNPAGQKSPAEELESITSVIDASERLRTAVGRLSGFTIGDLIASEFGRNGESFERWWHRVKQDLSELEQELKAPLARARNLVGSKNKKRPLEARDRLFRMIYLAIPSEIDQDRRIEEAGNILEAAGISLPSDTGARRKLLGCALG